MFEIKYFPGDVFVNAYAAIIASIPGNAFAAVCYHKKGFRVTLRCAMISAILGGVLILMMEESSLFPMFVLFAKFGIQAGFNVIYMAHADLFPVLFAATAMGICNTLARVGTIVAPNLAEV